MCTGLSPVKGETDSNNTRVYLLLICMMIPGNERPLCIEDRHGQGLGG